MIVKYFATIRTYTGENERRVDDAPATLGPLLETLAAGYGRLFQRAVFAGDELNPEIIILVNGRNVAYAGRLEAPLTGPMRSRSSPWWQADDREDASHERPPTHRRAPHQQARL